MKTIEIIARLKFYITRLLNFCLCIFRPSDSPHSGEAREEPALHQEPASPPTDPSVQAVEIDNDVSESPHVKEIANTPITQVSEPRPRVISEPRPKKPKTTPSAGLPAELFISDKPASGKRKSRKKREGVDAESLASAIVVHDELRDDTTRRRGKKSKSAVGELMERALMDASFFPAAKRWPVMDLCLYGAEFDRDDEEDTVNYVKLFPTNKWVHDLARPLNFHVLKAPNSDDWKAAYAMGMVQRDRTSLRGKAMRIKPFEKAEIGKRVRNHKFKEQRYAQPYDRAINYPDLEVFSMQVFGDPTYFSRYGFYNLNLAVSPREAFALADSGVLHMLDKTQDDEGVSHQELVRRRVRLSCGMQLMAEETWRVVLQYDDHRPKIAFMANAEIVKELLSLRKCSDKVKKQRMLHIVTSHSRRIREDVTTNVMRHYRGSTETLWNGCLMQLIPPIRETDAMVKMTAKIEEVRALTETVQPSVITSHANV